MKLRIGTRGSHLALTQTQWVARQLIEKGVDVTIHEIKTTGDKILDVPLAKVGGKGLFIKEIEDALLQGQIDIAVHSMKDMPTEIPFGAVIGAIPKREDPRDVLIARCGTSFSNLPFGSKVGTSSLRRQAQLKRVRPDLVFLPLRGNLNTRIRKLSEGEVDAVILAAAGLHRIGWQERITEYLPFDICLPAIGQGVLAIECRENDSVVLGQIAFLNDSETACEIATERAFLTRLEGGCQTPIAGFAKKINGMIQLEGLVANLSGTEIIREKKSAPIGQEKALGTTLAELLLGKGADTILKELLDS